MSIAVTPFASTARERYGTVPATAGAGSAARSANTVTAELPEDPTPVTPATVAVHLMKVPASRVVEAFVSLHRTLGQQNEDSNAVHEVATPPLPEAAGASAYHAESVAAGRAPVGRAVDLQA